MCTVTLPGTLEYTSLCPILYDKLISLPEKPEKVIFDFRHITFAKPDGITLLAATVDNLLNQDTKVGFKDAPNSPVFDYLQRMDFFKFFQIFEDESFNRHASNRRFSTLESIDISSDSQRIAKNLTNTITGASQQIYSIRSDLYNCLYESINNVIDHARLGHAHGFSMAQSYNRYNDCIYVISTADAGIGIRESLASGNGLLIIDNDCRALDLACQEGITGAVGIKDEFGNPRNKGMGLNQIDKIAESTNGYFLIVSGTASRMRYGNTVRYRENKWAWRGTLIIVTLYKSGIENMIPNLSEQGGTSVTFG